MLQLPLKKIVRHLDSLQNQRSSSITDFITNKELQSLDNLESLDYNLLRKESFSLGSSERYLDSSLSEWIFNHAQDPKFSDKVLLGFFNTGRYLDLIAFCETLSIETELSSQLILASAYRLGDWSKVNKLSMQWKLDAIPFDFICMIIKSCLETGHVDRLPHLFAALPLSSTPLQQQQVQVLSLLANFTQGIASEKDVIKLLDLLPSLTSEEISWFVRFFPLVTALAGTSPELERLIRRLWKMLAESKILVDLDESHSFLQSSKNSKRIGLILDSDSIDSVSLAEKLKQELLLINSDYKLFSIYLSSNTPTSLSDQNQISLFCRTTKESLSILRCYNFDVVIDTVGPQNPKWLLTAAQGFAPLQLAWFSSPFPIPSNSPYQGQLVDRWTSPNEASNYDVPWLKLSGSRQLLAPSNLNFSKITPRDESASLIVLGSSYSILRGAASLLKSCFNDFNIINLFFAHSCWHSPGALSAWWNHWLSEPLPANCHSLDLDSLPTNSRLIAVDLNLESPSNDAVRLLSRGIPVVTLSTSSMSARGTRGVLCSLGLDSLAPDDPDTWIQTIQALIEDPSTYAMISSHLESSLSSSLLCDYRLFAQDFIASVSLLESTRHS